MPLKTLDEAKQLLGAMDTASRDERFMATVYAMNSLLLLKGVYTWQEFQQLFTEWLAKDKNRKEQ
jgi:hypothetical protein